MDIIIIAVANVLAGVIIGLIIGPSTEREKRAYARGFRDGLIGIKENTDASSD